MKTAQIVATPVELTGPRRWGSLPSKSARIVLAVDGHRDADPRGLVVDAVVVDQQLVGDVDPVRDLCDRGPHPPLGVGDDLVLDLAVALDAVAAHELDEAALADVQRADHRPQVAGRHARRAAVGEDEAHQVLVLDAVLDDPDGRDPQTLVEDLLGVARKAARREAADLRQVADAGDEPDPGAVVVDGLHQQVLRQVVHAGERVVVEVDVVRADRLRAEAAQDLLDGEGRGRELRRAELALADELALLVEDGAREVERLVEHRRVGGVLERQAHLARDRREVVRGDGHRHRVDDPGLAGGHVTRLRRW